jgi:two-component system sensor histidine kinase PilS (NtrC family)
MPKLHRLLPPASPMPQHVNQILRRQLLWMLLLRIILYTALLGITYMLSDLRFGIILLPNSALILLLMLVYIFSIVSATALTRLHINARRFGFTQSLADTFFAGCLVYFTGISSSIFTSVFFFPIITGGLILPRRGGMIAAAASTLVYGILLFLEYKTIIPTYFSSFDFTPLQGEMELINLFAVKGLTFFLAALVSAMFGARLTSTEEVLSDTIQSFDKLSHLYKAIFDNISTGIITTSDDFIITSANTAALTIIGSPLADCIGIDIRTILPEIDLQHGTTRQATDFTKSDGTRIRIGYSHTSLHSSRPGNQADNRDPREDSILITLQDISEIEKMEHKLRQGEKMAAIGMMSAGIAHDFRNPLTAISGSAQVLATEFTSADSGANENLALTNIILRESDRLFITISDFLQFARPDIAERQWFSLLNCIEEVVQVCKANPQWPSSCRMDLEINPRIDIWADRKQFFTIMSHLLNNAIAFCPEGNERVRLRAKEITNSNNGELLRVSVEDNGPGIEKEKYEKIFEPFYTNRADGTGLGLAIVRQTVEGHRGTIEVAGSELGGAKLTLTLPYS